MFPLKTGISCSAARPAGESMDGKVLQIQQGFPAALRVFLFRGNGRGNHDVEMQKLRCGKRGRFVKLRLLRGEADNRFGEKHGCEKRRGAECRGILPRYGREKICPGELLAGQRSGKMGRHHLDCMYCAGGSPAAPFLF